ncbi:hypothetical protein BDN72DRAFT_74966 [Pluteus cervinus]|uniref:Uncharacterized protein n=1 Tax=Pluteus cervinus TaxID=181527 RepID=A0ACD3ASE1_9AGAR|nr:hypothetical protein BDN72DRAFT_74966 [Pluteus cervinus]
MKESAGLYRPTPTPYSSRSTHFPPIYLLPRRVAFNSLFDYYYKKMSARSSPVAPTTRQSVVDPAYLSDIYVSQGIPGGPTSSVPFPGSIPQSRPRILTTDLRNSRDSRAYTPHSFYRPSPLSRTSVTNSPSSVRTQRKRYSASNPFALPFSFDIRAQQTATPTPIAEGSNAEETANHDSHSQIDIENIDLESNITAPEVVQGGSTSQGALDGDADESTGLPQVKKFSWWMIPFQIYILFLLGLPPYYWSRVDGIFRDADGDLPSVSSAMDEDCDFTRTDAFAKNWEDFVSTMVKQWETFNFISIVLISAIIALLQIPTASFDDLTRSFGMFAFVCAMFSLTFGCSYVVRFASLKRPVEARTWVENIQRPDHHFQGFWNEWVLLSLPAVWLSWSLVLFIVCILSFVWHSTADALPTATGVFSFGLVPRIGVTTLVGLGSVYLVCMLTTFRSGWERNSTIRRSKA